MIKELKVAELVADRQLGTTDEDKRQLDRVQASMAKDGLKVPLLVNTDKVVLDGLRRLVAAQNLGWETIPCAVTNDYAQMLHMVTKAREAGWDDHPLHVVALHVRLHEYGEAYRATMRRLRMAGSWKHLFRDAAGIKAEWYLEQALDALSGARRVAARSPAHAALADELLRVAYNERQQLGGVRQLQSNMMSMNPAESRSALDSWIKRIKARQATKAGVTQHHKRLAAAASYPLELTAINAVVSSLEGIAMGVGHIEVPANIDPKIRRDLLRRLNTSRQIVARFTKELKGNDSE